MQKVMLFGVFDGIHEGHRSLFKQARALGDYLVVVVAPDHIVVQLKGEPPRHSMAHRLRSLKDELEVDQAVCGDIALSVWEIIERERPDLVAVGYDQAALKGDLEKHLPRLNHRPSIAVLDGFKADIYHSSLLQKASFKK